VKRQPPSSLVDLLADLGLATPGEVASVAGRVRRLARDLPSFESVWIDALAQARLVTPLQAAELCAGRGPALKLGAYVLHERLPSPGYGVVYRARHLAERRWVRLTLLSADAPLMADLERRLELLVRQSPNLNGPPLVPVVEHGAGQDLLWAASADIRGQTAQQWLIRHGRMPPTAVLQIARQLLMGLDKCDQSGVPHGDLSAAQLWLDERGGVWLPEPGLRSVARPTEGFGRADLPPHAYDYLAPERVEHGTLPNLASDLYAWGALCWHLLAGRPPVPGATALIKLRAAQTAKIADIQRVVADAPPALTRAVMSCLARDPARRPESLAALTERLSAPTAGGRKQLARALRRPRVAHSRLAASAPAWRARRRTPLRMAVVASALFTAVVAAWPACWPWLTGRAAPVPRQAGASAGAAARGDAARSGIAPPAKPADAMRDGQLTSYTADLDDRAAIAVAWREDQSLLELPAGPAAFDPARLRAGQTVRPRKGSRAQVAVPADGLVIEPDGLTFENIDFIGDSSGEIDALLRLRARKVTFRGCSFESAPSSEGDLASTSFPVGLAWEGELGTADDLATARLELRDVVFRRLSAAIRAPLNDGLVAQLTNVLHLGPGPLVAVERFPSADSLLALALTRITLREAAAVIDLSYDDLGSAGGQITVQASDCAFILPPAAGLLVYRGEEKPGPLLTQLHWTGQGSVLSRQARLALWRTAAGVMRAAAESAVPIEGLVRTDVGFAGPIEAEPAQSRIVRWQAPLRSPQPPGIDDRTLPQPAAH
jgi:eukaryotic-like serine/threonine-protein kinase